MKKQLLSLFLSVCLLCAGLPTALAVDLPNAQTESPNTAIAATEDAIPSPTDSDYDKILNDRARRIASTDVSKAYQAATKRSYPAKAQSYDVYKTYQYVAPNAYADLTDAQKALYDEMLPKIRNLEYFSYTAKDDGYDKMDDSLVALSALFEDYPELDIYCGLFDVLDGDTTIALEVRYYMPDSFTDQVLTTQEDLNNLRYELDLFDAVCDYIVAGMPEGTAYNKYLYLASYIASRTEYDYDAKMGPQIGNAYGAIMTGNAICEGYSTAMVYLCKKANLYCKMVSGSSHEMSHAWNLVKLSTGTYHVDITWSDTSGAKLASNDWYQYFMLTHAEIYYDHEISDGTFATGITLPKPEKTSEKLYVGSTYLVKDLSYRIIKGAKNGKGTVAVCGGFKKTPLTSLTIPSKVTINGVKLSVTGIDSKVLRNCKNLKKLTLGTKVTSIGSYAFANNKSLKDITIRSKSLKKVGRNAIRNINKKAVIHVPSGKRNAYKKLFTANTGYKKTMKITAA